MKISWTAAPKEVYSKIPCPKGWAVSHLFDAMCLCGSCLPYTTSIFCGCLYHGWSAAMLHLCFDFLKNNSQISVSFLEALLPGQHEKLQVSSASIKHLVCNVPAVSGDGMGSSPEDDNPPHLPYSLLTSQWINLPQFKKFFMPQFLHNRFICIQELPMKSDVCFLFFQQDLRILDSV